MAGSQADWSRLAPNRLKEARRRSSMPWHNFRSERRVPAFNRHQERSKSDPSRMRPRSSLNGNLESVPLRRLTASIQRGHHCCVAAAVVCTGGPSIPIHVEDAGSYGELPHIAASNHQPLRLRYYFLPDLCNR